MRSGEARDKTASRAAGYKDQPENGLPSLKRLRSTPQKGQMAPAAAHCNPGKPQQDTGQQPHVGGTNLHQRAHLTPRPAEKVLEMMHYDVNLSG